jgi:NMT1/THI5 like protein
MKAFALLALALFIARAAEAEVLRLGYSGATPTQLAGALAVEQKLFEHYGVSVELNQSAGLTMIRALESQSLDVAIVGGGQALAAYMKGVEVRVVSGLVNTVPFQLWSPTRRREPRSISPRALCLRAPVSTRRAT